MKKWKKNKGDANMITANLKDIEQQVISNSLKFQKQIEAFEKRIDNSGWNKGRLRPKHPTEARILSRFKQK
ncbi:MULTISPECIES: hypothetical protein [Bacillaceae]|uniref:hypothetical protein n=1 Tax=Bacillaceae TaxID=186817 RepID=UPI00115CBBB8|nr:hypothetical protein [Bacillus sp. PK3_68]